MNSSSTIVFVDFALFQEALDTAELVEKIMKEDSKTKPLLPLQLIRHREIQLPDGKCQAKGAQKNDETKLGEPLVILLYSYARLFLFFRLFVSIWSAQWSSQ